MIQIEKGHFWLTFENGYEISVFNGFGSYSENNYKSDLCKSDVSMISSKNCEISIMYKELFATDSFVESDDSVKGYVSADKLADIIYKVKNCKR